MSVGAFHTCGIRAGAQLWCWGYNFDGEVGKGTSGSGTNQLAPIQIGASTGWTGVVAGANHTCGLHSMQLWCWGSNVFGQLGDGTNTDANAPRQVGSASDWGAVGVGDFHTCAIRVSQLYCFGYNNAGQLGDGGTTNQNAPEQIGIKTDWVSVDGGATHTVGSRNVPANE